MNTRDFANEIINKSGAKDFLTNDKARKIYEAVIGGKGPNVYCVRLGGLDELALRLTDDSSVESRVLRISKNIFTGTRVYTLHLKEGERFLINRTVFGLGALSFNGIKTVEAKTYLVTEKILIQIPDLDLQDYTTPATDYNELSEAASQLIGDIIGLENLVVTLPSKEIQRVRFETSLKLNTASIARATVYEVTAPKVSKTLTNKELADARGGDYKNDTIIPEGTIYVKVPVDGSEIVICGSPNTLGKYINAMNGSSKYLLHLDPNNSAEVLSSLLTNSEIVTGTSYFILPNIDI